MKIPVFLLALMIPLFASAEVPSVTPAIAAQRVAEGKAVLIDVREPSEWAESGVAAPALLLAKSDFDAGRRGAWKQQLEAAGDREIIVYCRSGRRSGAVAETLAKEGRKVSNAGGFKDWETAGLPVRPVAKEK